MPKKSFSLSQFDRIKYMWKILRFDGLDSTNAYAKRHCSLLTDRTVIVAQTQTAGRGRLDRKWLSQKGGLYFSLLLKPQKIDFLPNLTQLMALSVCQTARNLGANAWLKWPNDVLADGRKLCGILSEAVTGKSGFEALALGCGVNVRQNDLNSAGQPAASLHTLGIETDEDSVLQEVLGRFFAQYDNVLRDGFKIIRTDYLARFPYLGKEVCVKNGPTQTRGVAETISPEGKLKLHTPRGFMEISIGDMMV